MHFYMLTYHKKNVFTGDLFSLKLDTNHIYLNVTSTLQTVLKEEDE